MKRKALLNCDGNEIPADDLLPTLVITDLTGEYSKTPLEEGTNVAGLSAEELMEEELLPKSAHVVLPTSDYMWGKRVITRSFSRHVRLRRKSNGVITAYAMNREWVVVPEVNIYLREGKAPYMAVVWRAVDVLRFFPKKEVKAPSFW